MFKTIAYDVESEIVEKKSRFIANIFYVENENEAEQKIKEIRKKYFDAKHHCFAYSIYDENQIISRFSDDGEPSGTAGSPMLNILNSENIKNVVVIVTRYFGGILLGTGGLLRAYTGSLQDAIAKAQIVNKDLGLIANAVVTYSDFEKLKYFFKNQGINIINEEYEQDVKVHFEITEEKYNYIMNKREEFNFKILNSEVEKKCFILV